RSPLSQCRVRLDSLLLGGHQLPARPTRSGGLTHHTTRRPVAVAAILCRMRGEGAHPDTGSFDDAQLPLRSAIPSIAGDHQPSVTWRIVFPATRGVCGPNAAGGPVDGPTAPTFEVSRPSRSRRPS